MTDTQSILTERNRTDIRADCLGTRCWSPMACSVWGYCRNRHFLPTSDPDYRDPKAWGNKS